MHNLTDGPATISIGSVTVPIYGMAYMLGYLLLDRLGHHRIKKLHTTFSKSQLTDLWMFFGMGSLAGARIVDILLYQCSPLFFDWVPLIQQRIDALPGSWKSLSLLIGIQSYLGNLFFVLVVLLLVLTGSAGMSFHGGVLGGILGVWLYSRRFKNSFLQLMDFIVPLLPPGILLGRLANFINGELWGKPTNMPWGVIFSRADCVPRHPSQIYEAILEGLLLFIILWKFSNQTKPKGAILGLGMSLYAVLRIFVEYFREPNSHAVFLLWHQLSIGQILSLPMLTGGVYLLFKAYRQ